VLASIQVLFTMPEGKGVNKWFVYADLKKNGGDDLQEKKYWGSWFIIRKKKRKSQLT